MNMQLVYMFLLMGAILAILLVGEYLHKRKAVASEYTRKMAHVLGSLSSLLFLYLFDSYWYVVGIGGFFFLLLFLGKRKNLFNSIEGVQRTTAGSYLLPMSITGLFVIARIYNNDLLFVLPILVLGISDPLAGILGVHFKQYTRSIRIGQKKLGKTYLGSFVFFLSAVLLSFVVLYSSGVFFAQAILMSMIIALMATMTELFSTKGYDNLLIPMVVSLLVQIL